MTVTHIRTLGALALLLCSIPVYAGKLDWAPYLEYGVEHDSNIFSLAGDERADTSQRATLGILANWPVSRQTFVLAAQASAYRYTRFSRLDHSEHDARGAWKFMVGPAVYGTVSYQDQRYLEDFSDRASTEADYIRERKPQIEGYLGIMPDWRLRGQYARLDLTHSLGTSRRFDRRDNDGTLELQYMGAPGSEFGAGAEIVGGEFPGRPAGDPLARRFLQTTAFTAINWKYSGKSRFLTRLGYTWRQNSGISGNSANRDFAGFTGRLGYERTISGKTRLYTEVFREIYSDDNVDANYVRVTGAKLETTYTYSPKLDLMANASYRQRDYQALSGGGSRRDDVSEFGAKMVYQPYRVLAVILNTGVVNRDSNRAGRSYNAVVGGLALRLTLGYVPP